MIKLVIAFAIGFYVTLYVFMTLATTKASVLGVIAN